MLLKMRGVKMELWIIYGLVAAFAFGVNAIIYKMGFHGNPYLLQLIFGLGILVTFLSAFAIKDNSFNITGKNALLIFIAGVVWALGFLMITLGLASGFEISKMAILYNTNFLVTVVLGVLIFKELNGGGELIRTIIGAVLIVAGILVVSLK